MFKYSIDEYIASEQKNSGERLLEGICEKCSIQMSPELDAIITSYKMSGFGFLQEVCMIAEKCGEPLVFVASERDNYGSRVLSDFKRGFDKLDKPWKDTLPYIEYSFPNVVKMPLVNVTYNMSISFSSPSIMDSMVLATVCFTISIRSTI